MKTSVINDAFRLPPLKIPYPHLSPFKSANVYPITFHANGHIRPKTDLMPSVSEHLMRRITGQHTRPPHCTHDSPQVRHIQTPAMPRRDPGVQSQARGESRITHSRGYLATPSGQPHHRRRRPSRGHSRPSRGHSRPSRGHCRPCQHCSTPVTASD